MWNFCGHIFARKIKLKLRSNSIASSDFGDYEIPAREYTEYNKPGILYDRLQSKKELGLIRIENTW